MVYSHIHLGLSLPRAPSEQISTTGILGVFCGLDLITFCGRMLLRCLREVHLHCKKRLPHTCCCKELLFSVVVVVPMADGGEIIIALASQ